jgi:succinate dehydrogenase / fumarate reductase cytochrome b subunit
MTNLKNTLNSSLGKKYVMAATGLFLCIFLLEHLYGNLLLYKSDGGEAFNQYSHDLVHSILIRIVEVVLFASIILHVYQALKLTNENNSARKIKYAVSKVDETSNWFSRNMGLTGSLILFFIVVHLYTFFVPYRITHEVTNSALAVKTAFKSGVYSLFYVIAVGILGFHLNHGFQSAFQTLGFNNKNYMPLLKQIGTGFAVLITVGFASFPILFYFGLVGQTF